MTIPEKAVEAARASYAWDEYVGEIEVQRMLEAAAPFIVKQALENAASAWSKSDDPYAWINPDTWLRRQAAAEQEKGTS